MNIKLVGQDGDQLHNGCDGIHKYMELLLLRKTICITCEWQAIALILMTWELQEFCRYLTLINQHIHNKKSLVKNISSIHYCVYALINVSQKHQSQSVKFPVSQFIVTFHVWSISQRGNHIRGQSQRWHMELLVITNTYRYTFRLIRYQHRVGIDQKKGTHN